MRLSVPAGRSVADIAFSVERRGYKAGRAQRSSWACGASCPRFAFVGGRSAHAVPAGWQVSHLFVGGYVRCAKNCAVDECEVPAVQVMSLSGGLACRHPVHVNRRYDVPDLWMTNHGPVDAFRAGCPCRLTRKLRLTAYPQTDKSWADRFWSVEVLLGPFASATRDRLMLHGDTRLSGESKSALSGEQE